MWNIFQVRKLSTAGDALNVECLSSRNPQHQNPQWTSWSIKCIWCWTLRQCIVESINSVTVFTVQCNVRISMYLGYRAQPCTLSVSANLMYLSYVYRATPGYWDPCMVPVLVRWPITSQLIMAQHKQDTECCVATNVVRVNGV
jgi:hypothetical protein